MKALAPLPLDQVIQGDCLDVLARLPEKSVDLVFADPPYNLQLQADLYRPNMTKVDAVDDAWDKFSSFAAYDAFTRQWLGACRRVLKDEGTIWSIGSYHNVHRLGTVLQDLDYWILNDVAWIKCVAGTTRVYVKSPKGERPIAVHDLVAMDPATTFLWNGQRWTQVAGYALAPASAGVEITLRSGEKIRCTPNHVWPTQRGMVEARSIETGDVIEACQLPEPSNDAQIAGLEDKLIGWFVGLYLAEGSRYEDTIQISGNIKEDHRIARLTEVASAYDGSCTAQRKAGQTLAINLNGKILNAILDTYLAGSSATDKHLMPKCWNRSNQFLHSLLEGYLEGDGSFDAANNMWQLGFVQNYRLESDLRTLCARLGASLRLKPRTIRSQRHSIAYLNSRDFYQFYGTLRFERSQHGNNKSDTEVMCVAPSLPQAFFDIAVQDEPHLIALASGVLTHNSNPMPNFRGVRFTNAHETLIWAQKVRGAKYTFNYRSMKALNEDLQMRSDWYLSLCTGKERLKIDGAKAHPTQKPEALLYRVILATSRPGQVVLDPFFGTGTTGAVAKTLHRHWIGVEREARYVTLARDRIEAVQPSMFDDEVYVFDSQKRESRLPFGTLLEHGLLQPGQTLYFGPRAEACATVLANGQLKHNETIGSIHSVGRAIRNAPCNGWEHWYYEDPDSGERLSINHLRIRLRQDAQPTRQASDRI